MFIEVVAASVDSGCGAVQNLRRPRTVLAFV